MDVLLWNFYSLSSGHVLSRELEHYSGAGGGGRCYGSIESPALMMLSSSDSVAGEDILEGQFCVRNAYTSCRLVSPHPS